MSDLQVLDFYLDCKVHRGYRKGQSAVEIFSGFEADKFSDNQHLIVMTALIEAVKLAQMHYEKIILPAMTDSWELSLAKASRLHYESLRNMENGKNLHEKLAFSIDNKRMFIERSQDPQLDNDALRFYHLFLSTVFKEINNKEMLQINLMQESTFKKALRGLHSLVADPQYFGWCLRNRLIPVREGLKEIIEVLDIYSFRFNFSLNINSDSSKSFIGYELKKNVGKVPLNEIEQAIEDVISEELSSHGDYSSLKELEDLSLRGANDCFRSMDEESNGDWRWNID